jgi:hypothetical protein
MYITLVKKPKKGVGEGSALGMKCTLCKEGTAANT